MSAVPITIVGTITTPSSGAADGGSKTEQCTIAGLASLTGLHVGGGPIEPGPSPTPPGIWGGGNEPFPTPPIVIIPPDKPGKPPLVIWGGGNEPFPTPPIYIKPPDKPGGPWVIWGGGNEPFPTPPINLLPIPKPPDPFPEPPPEVVKPPPDEGGWGYADPPGVWYFSPGTGQPGPK